MLAVISTVVGRASAVWTSATASSVSYRPQSMNVTVSGTARIGDREGARDQNQHLEGVAAAEGEARERVARRARRAPATAPA